MYKDLKSSYVAPYTNRGVLCTIESGPILLFDWVQVTIFPFEKSKGDTVEEILDYAKLKNTPGYLDTFTRFHDIFDLIWYLFRIPRTEVLVNAFKPILSYDRVYSFKNIKILENLSRPDFGIHILLSGTACRELEDRGVSYGELFYKLREFKPHYTRLDVTYDDFTGKYWTLDRICKCINNVEVVTRFRSSLQIKKEDLISLDNIGHTIQFGSRSSDIQFTFYDKLKERQSNGFDLLEDYSSIKCWNRFETRFRNDHALEVVNNYLYFKDYDVLDFSTKIMCNSFNEYMKSVINNYISFRIRSESDSNRRRWLLQPWWKRFLDGADKIQFMNKPIEYSILKKKDWLDRTCSYSNFCVMLAELPDLSDDLISSKYLYNLFKIGSDKITEKDLQFINEYRISRSLNVFTLEEINAYAKEVKEILVRK